MEKTTNPLTKEQVKNLVRWMDMDEAVEEAESIKEIRELLRTWSGCPKYK